MGEEISGLSCFSVSVRRGMGVVQDLSWNQTLVNQQRAVILESLSETCAFFAHIILASGVALAKCHLHGRKNSPGCYYPPSLVLVAPELLGTLPSEHLIGRLAESIKMAVNRADVGRTRNEFH